MGLFSFFKDAAANAKNAQIYGAPSAYLRNVTNKLRSISLNYSVIAENNGRLKVQTEHDKFILKTEFIYFADYLQVTFDVIGNSKTVKVFKCPYDSAEIEKVVDTFVKANSQSNDGLKDLMRMLLPKGEADITAGTKAVLNIIGQHVNKDVARNIFLKSYTISSTTEDFTETRLAIHLKGYCAEYFNGSTVHDLFQYLTALKAAMLINQRSPAEVKKDGEDYIW